MTAKGDPSTSGRADAPAPVLAGQLDFASAWSHVERKAGMPGVDGVPVSRFRRDATSWLRALESGMAGERYRPAPLRMATIRKESGALRILMVPTVTDRIAQTAVSAWLGARWNPEFDVSSFAYRPGKGVAHTLRALRDLRDRGFLWVLDADLQSFFDSIPHDRLFARLAAWMGAASPMLKWVQRWVAATVWDGSQLCRVACGVPQGSPLSPLLSNFYLDEFDRRLRARGIPFVRYADDFLVFAKSPFDLSDARAFVEEALQDLGLVLNPSKTRVTTFEQSFRFLGAEVQNARILVPFEKERKAKVMTSVAPVMPPALLRAYRSGEISIQAVFSPSTSAPSLVKAAEVQIAERKWWYEAVAGSGQSSAMQLLRGKRS